ncbi:MAG TPA: response regulator [Bryobacteraceae bacterium]|nr:response regulator [Bryobacteraceae bacterium]
MRSLVADDSPIVRILLKRMLSQYGDCDEARDGREAVIAFMRRVDEKNPYDLICLDLQMPVVDGIKVLETIRQAEKEQQLKRARVLVVTAEADIGRVKSAVELGADGYLVKPISHQTLADRLAALVPELVSFLPAPKK